jgi:hypothetical protein
MQSLLKIGALLVVLVLTGCNGKTHDNDHSKASNPAELSKQPPDKNAPGKAEEHHGHKTSAHGGILVSIGRDNYHAEAVFEKGGFLRLYILGQDESKLQEVASQPLNAFVKAEGDAESVSFVLRPEPQAGDAKEMTSLFLGHLPKDLVGKKLEVTIPAIKIGNDRFRIAFKSNPPTGDDHGMPAKVADDSEKKLYLTPGGAYTEADIEANGHVTASEKFKGLKADHDLKPKSGDKICPITLTKANPKFTWIVGGKSYEFCCPPCVDEFVALAKEKPSEVQDPETYRKK